MVASDFGCKQAKYFFIWLVVFGIVFVLAVDWWNWNQSTPVLFGVPFWILRVMVLTVALTPLFWLFSRWCWREQ